MKSTILVTGGTGFIGSHTCVALLDAGHDVIVIDNLCNSESSMITRIGKICGREPIFAEGDIRDTNWLDELFENYAIDSVIHFAGLKAVGESVLKPMSYYENNVGGTISLLNAMRRSTVRTIVFSSSATVYGNPRTVPVTEDFPRSATNPYGASKLMVEDILADLYRSENPDGQHVQGWRIGRLRYFNPVGAHESGLIGELPRGVPNNLMPFITQAAAGIREELCVFGNDYDTHDGTGVRDYIHVMDLAQGHIAALDYLTRNPSLLTVNLGTGYGASVLDLIRTFETTNNCRVPFRISGRRPGDTAMCWADTSLAMELLNWQASRGIEDMCRDAWRWQLASMR